MKKKLLSLMLVAVVAIGLTACGGSGDSDTKEATTQESTKIEKSIDAVAEELGLTGGSDTLYEMIGATAGKEYNDGAVELYQFDADSNEYKDIVDGNGVITAAAYKDGIVLVFSSDADSKIIEAFNDLEFK